MIAENTHIAGVRVLKLDNHQDSRGDFTRAFCRKSFEEVNLPWDLVQWNISTNPFAGTLRGLHWQDSSAPEDKLVHCVQGRIWDVAVDMRNSSPTFGKSFGIELTSADPIALQVPKGCAHGFLTLEENCTVIYGVSGAYSPTAEKGARWNDPSLSIVWPSEPRVISEKDANWENIAL